MGTTLYFADNTASARESGTYPAASTNYANLTPTASVTTEGFMMPCASRNGATTYLQVSTGTGTAAKINRFGRFFSAPFEEDYTYTHPTTSGSAIKYFLADYESNLSANHCVEQCYVYVWRPSTGAVVGVVQPVSVLAPGSKEPNAASSIRSTLGSYFSSTPGTISILAGDILIFEPFSTYTKSSSTSYTTRFYYAGQTEITAENTLVSKPASKVVFSVDLPLAPPKSVARSFARFSAKVELLGPRFSSILQSKSRIPTAKLTDGSPLNSVLHSRAASSAVLTAQILLSSSLKSISKTDVWINQTHELSIAINIKSLSIASFPNSYSVDTLAFYYTGGVGNTQPSQSLGGPRGGVLQGSLFSTSGDLPGVEILAVHGAPDGVHYVRVDGQKRKVSLVLIDALSEFSTTVNAGTSVVCVGSELSGFVVLRVTPNPSVSGTVSISTTHTTDTLFSTPTQQEYVNGGINYRGLFLFNDTDSDAMNVTVTLAYVSESTFDLGTEYPYIDRSDPIGGSTGESTPYLSGKRMPMSVKHRALDATGWGGIFAMEQPRGNFVKVAGLPTVLGTEMPETWSDGLTTMLPSVIQGQEDGSSELSSLDFFSSLYWRRLPARSSLSLWVRRTTPPGATPVPESKLTLIVNADV